MDRRGFLIGSIGSLAAVAGCAETQQSQQPASVTLRPVLYNRTENIETFDLTLYGPDEILFETTYTLGVEETVVADETMRFMTGEQYTIAIDRQHSERGVYTITPEPEAKALAVYIRDESNTVRQERTVPPTGGQ